MRTFSEFLNTFVYLEKYHQIRRLFESNGHSIDDYFKWYGSGRTDQEVTRYLKNIGLHEGVSNFWNAATGGFRAGTKTADAFSRVGGAIGGGAAGALGGALGGLGSVFTGGYRGAMRGYGANPDANANQPANNAQNPGLRSGTLSGTNVNWDSQKQATTPAQPTNHQAGQIDHNKLSATILGSEDFAKGLGQLIQKLALRDTGSGI